MKQATKPLVLQLLLLLLTGCGAHFITPAGGVPMSEITDDLITGGSVPGAPAPVITDHDLKKFYELRPAAVFPANIAMIRVQDSGYRPGYPGARGRYTTVTTRDIESDEAYESLLDLDLVRSVAPVGRMLVPANANSVKDLRIAAAKLQTDMVLVYTVDTAFTVDGRQYGPLSTISLGLLRNKRAHVTATVAGILVDVRTGFVYGTAEASHTEIKKSTIWATEMVVNSARRVAEQQAFDDFVDEFTDLWAGVAGQHAGPSVAGSRPPGPRYYTLPKQD